MTGVYVVGGALLVGYAILMWLHAYTSGRIRGAEDMMAIVREVRKDTIASVERAIDEMTKQ